MKVAIYARESSGDTKNAPPITTQIERGKQWASQNNYELIEIYVDDGYSGGDWKRPGWIQARKDARRHFYKVLWVWNQDRLARDTEQFLFFYRSLKEAKCLVYEDTSRDYIDMESLGNRVKHQSLAQAAEIFRLVTSEKVKAAYLRKKDSTHWGRPKISIDIEKARKLRSKGNGWRTIAKELGVSHNTVRRALQNNLILEHSKIEENLT